MKKVIMSSLAALLVMGTAASAHNYKNEAFWGEWVSKSNSESDSVRFCINYIDNDSVEADFKQITDGLELFEFTEYSGTVSNRDTYIHAELKFDYRDEYGTTKPGHMEFDMYEDNIWLTVVSNDGITFFNGQLVSTQQQFDPTRSPFSSDPDIELNGTKQSFTDAKPFIVNGTTYVPLRGLLDSMNLNVYWDDAFVRGKHIQMITTSRNDKILQFAREITPGGNAPWTLSRWDSERADTLAEPNDTLDISVHQPVIMNDRSYVPLRILSEGYGAVVDWDNSTRTVIINDNIASDTKKTAGEVNTIQAYDISGADNAAKGYVGMVRYDETPRYNNKSKYFIYTQDEKLYKLFYDGSVSEITE